MLSYACGVVGTYESQHLVEIDQPQDPKSIRVPRWVVVHIAFPTLRSVYVLYVLRFSADPLLDP